MRGKHSNKWKLVDGEEHMWSVWTQPKFAIGQRCVLLETPEGNVLWDCITYLDDETVEFIKAKGGLKAIVISHPHYYTTHMDWAKAFDCPVVFAKDDEEWINRKDFEDRRRLMESTTEEIIPGVTAARPGGHFPGSLVLLWNKHLLIADTFVTTPVTPLPAALKHLSSPDTTDIFPVRILPPQPPPRHNQLRLHVVHPKHDPSASLRTAQNVASAQAA